MLLVTCGHLGYKIDFFNFLGNSLAFHTPVHSAPLNELISAFL